MKTLKNHIDTWGTLGVFAALFTLAMLMFALLARSAHADPLLTAQATTDAGIGLLESAGPIIGGMYLAYALGNSLLAKYRSSSWLAQGKRLAYTTGGIGIAGAALQAQVAGGPWTVIVMAAVAALFKLLTPTVEAAPGPARNPQTGAIEPWVLLMSVVLLGGMVVAGVLNGCATARQRGAASAGAFLDCEAADLPPTSLHDATEFATKAVMAAISGDGHADTSQIRADASVLRSDLGKCALAAAIAALATPGPVIVGAPAAAELAIDGPGLRRAFAAARAELGWAPVRPVGGVVPM